MTRRLRLVEELHPGGRQAPPEGEDVTPHLSEVDPNQPTDQLIEELEAHLVALGAVVERALYQLAWLKDGKTAPDVHDDEGFTTMGPFPEDPTGTDGPAKWALRCQQPPRWSL